MVSDLIKLALRGLFMSRKRGNTVMTRKIFICGQSNFDLGQFCDHKFSSPQKYFLLYRSHAAQLTGFAVNLRISKIQVLLLMLYLLIS
jgi:hypothetical protein